MSTNLDCYFVNINVSFYVKSVVCFSQKQLFRKLFKGKGVTIKPIVLVKNFCSGNIVI